MFFTASVPSTACSFRGDFPEVGVDEPLASFVQQLPQCVVIYDDRGRCLLANSAALRWLGHDEADVLGRSISDLWPASVVTRETADLALVLEGGRIEAVERRGERNVTAVKFPWATQTGLVRGMVVVFDELETPPVSSLSQPEMIGRLALGIVHDFNNALTLLRGQVDLTEELLSCQPGAARCLQNLQKVLDHASELPRQLLGFIRNEPLCRQRVDLNALLRSLEGLLRSRLQRGATLDYRLDLVGAWVEGDPVQLTQVFLNLASNALDAMPEGGRLTLETHLLTLSESDESHRRSGARGDFIRVTMRDSGPGIAPEVLPRIFEPLFSTKAPGSGSGLGLAIVNEVVQRHGGWITCQSNPGSGACFVLHLPTATPAAANRRHKRAASVLVVEREPDIRHLTAMILEQGPFHVEQAGNWTQARERIAAVSGRIDLVLLSDGLCSGAGVLLLQGLMEQLPGARLLITTSGQPPMLSAECSAGFRGLVPKPYSADQLLRAVQAALWGPNCPPGPADSLKG